jgi:enoyl-CoA hydratase/carnithine racemase
MSVSSGRERVERAGVSGPLRIEQDAPRAGVWRLVLDDAPRANALSPALVGCLQAALRTAFERDVRCIVIASSSERFCAGADLGDVEHLDDSALRDRFSALEDLLETVRRAPALTIAVVRGAALGAGADLVASCDYRLGTPKARLAFPGSRFGVVLGTRHLATVVGRQAARELLVEGKSLDAQAAARCGLLSELCSDDAVDSRVESIAQSSEAIDAPTLRAILRLTRELPSERDRAELLQSTSRGGLAERLREHARRAQEQRALRRTAGQ